MKMKSWMVMMSVGALVMGGAAACGGDDEGTGGGTSTGTGSGTGSGTSAGTGTGTNTGTGSGTGSGTGAGTGAGTGTGSGMAMLDTCTEDLDPQESPADIVISEVSVGSYIELYNPTGSDIDLGTSTHFWCSRPAYPAVSATASGIVVPAGGYRTVDWPSQFSASTATDGEVAIYSDSQYANAGSVLDFVCWGNGNQMTRKATAEAAGEWSGDCIASPTNGVVKRNASTSGSAAADWDGTVMEDPTDCAP